MDFSTEKHVSAQSLQSSHEKVLMFFCLRRSFPADNNVDPKIVEISAHFYCRESNSDSFHLKTKLGSLAFYLKSPTYVIGYCPGRKTVKGP